ncbi:integral membrane protein GPR180 isoform X1 [Hydra vulgaris]|nr:integral membrane protein GPR180-like isoform X1 [Hydra vulgaris]XP_047130306.1 integral membrane protein GPR180-like isoform X1 [Hydra vulgaris]
MFSTRLVILVLLIKYISGKSLDGVFSLYPGVHHLERFCFDVNGVLKFTLNATDENLHLVLLTDREWYNVKNNTCEEVKAITHHDVALNSATKVYHFHPTQKKSPQYLNLCYVRCNSSTDIAYNIELMNQFYVDGQYSHFDYGESDLPSFNQFFLIAYLVVFAMYGNRLYAIVKKGGPMHMVRALRMLTTAQILRLTSFFFMLIHYYRYSINGYGFPVILYLCKVIDGYNHYLMLIMITKLATAGILSSSSTFLNNEKLTHYIIIFITIFQTVFMLFSQIFFLLMLRIFVAFITAYFIQNAIVKERSALKRDFYHKLVRDNYILWWSLPFAAISSIIFAEYHHQKLIAFVTTVGQTISALFMYQLFISRSLYWEVSSLSSATLPLRVDNSFGMKKYTS